MRSILREIQCSELAAHSLNPFCVFAARLLQQICGCKSKARGRGRLNLRPEKPRRHSHAPAMRLHLRLCFFQKQKVYKGVLPFTYGQLFGLFSNLYHPDKPNHIQELTLDSFSPLAHNPYCPALSPSSHNSPVPVATLKPMAVQNTFLLNALPATENHPTIYHPKSNLKAEGRQTHA